MPRVADPSLRAVFEDPDMSLAAKGAPAVILTRPPGARVSPEDLFSSSSDHMTVVAKAVRELARFWPGRHVAAWVVARIRVEGGGRSRSD